MNTFPSYVEYLRKVTEATEAVSGIPYARNLDPGMHQVSLAFKGELAPERFAEMFAEIHKFQDVRDKFGVDRIKAISYNQARSALAEFALHPELSWSMAQDGWAYATIDGSTYRIGAQANMFITERQILGERIDINKVPRDDDGHAIVSLNTAFERVATGFDIGDVVAAAENAADKLRPMRHLRQAPPEPQVELPDFG
jgi:hypothetical protein